MAENNNGAFIWSIANLLRGVYKQADYGKVILPFTVLRRLDALLEPTKAAVLETLEKNKSKPGLEHILPTASEQKFYNTSKFTLAKLAGDPANLRANLLNYVEGFSPNVKDIFERYDFAAQTAKLDENDLLYLVLQKFAAVDLHPDRVSTIEMGLIFEELIRKFAEVSNETASDHFTPREVVRLIVSLLFTEHPDDDPSRSLTVRGAVRTVYDPAAGTGGMLSVADDYVREHFPHASLTLMGQELNAESFAIAKADMVIKGQTVENIVWGDTLTADGHPDRTFDFGLSNPPFGLDWTKQRSFVQKEFQEQGYEGRFGPGLPRVSDGSLLFLLHMVKKMRPKRDGGGRVGIVLNGSPLFTGDAGSGESSIREYLLESDLVDAIVALPSELFYNTDIATYIWILDNDKPDSRKGTIQLIDATDQSEKMRKRLHKKRREISRQQIADIVKLYGKHEESEVSKIFRKEDFGYTSIAVERPLQLSWAIAPENLEEALSTSALIKLTDDERNRLALQLVEAARTTDQRAFTELISGAASRAQVRLTTPQVKALVAAFSKRDETAPVLTDAKGSEVSDPTLREFEKVPLTESIDEFVAREIKPHLERFWIDESSYRVGYEIPFTRIFYKYQTSRTTKEIDGDLEAIVREIASMLAEMEAAR